MVMIAAEAGTSRTHNASQRNQVLERERRPKEATSRFGSVSSCSLKTSKHA